MKKKVLALFLTVCMVIGLTACSTSKNNSSTNKVTTASEEKSEKLVVSFRTNGNVPEEGQIKKVEDALNKILREKINCEVQLMIIQSGSYQQQMTLMLAGNEQLDVMGATFQMLAPAVSSEQLRDLSGLLNDYGQGILSTLSPELLGCGLFNGTQYSIPIQADSAVGMGFYVMRKDIVDKYNIDVNSIKSYEDLTKVYELVHEKEPDLTILAPRNAGMSFLEYNCTWDKLGNQFGVLDNYGQDGLNVVNLFETQSYKNYLDVVREWYQKGFISGDVTNATESGPALMKAGNLFSYCGANKPGIYTQEKMATGYEVVGTQVLESITWTGNAFQWTIPENAKYPEKAMQFLNLMYTEPDIINTLVYGIEGEDYEVHEDGRIGYPKGIDATSVGYSLSSMLWSFGNEFNAYVWETNDADIWEQTIEWNKTGLRSKAYGFVFDSTPVATEMAAVQNVYNQYSMSLECGVVEPTEVLVEMNEKLYAAGLQNIIDEKQRQLDLWNSAKDK